MNNIIRNIGNVKPSAIYKTSGFTALYPALKELERNGERQFVFTKYPFNNVFKMFPFISQGLDRRS